MGGACSPRLSDRTAITTVAPFAASAAAVDLPMPVLEPLTIATFPRRSSGGDASFRMPSAFSAPMMGLATSDHAIATTSTRRHSPVRSSLANFESPFRVGGTTVLPAAMARHGLDDEDVRGRPLHQFLDRRVEMHLPTACPSFPGAIRRPGDLARKETAGPWTGEKASAQQTSAPRAAIWEEASSI